MFDTFTCYSKAKNQGHEGCCLSQSLMVPGGPLLVPWSSRSFLVGWLSGHPWLVVLWWFCGGFVVVLSWSTGLHGPLTGGALVVP